MRWLRPAARSLYARYVSAGYPLLPVTRFARRPLRWLYHRSRLLRHDSRFYLKPYLLSTLHRALIVDHPPDFTLYDGQIQFRSYGSEMSVHGYYVGEIEYHLACFIINQLQPGFTMIDVGAHHGAHTLVVACELKKRGWPGRVYSFEPNRENYALLKHNVQQNHLAEYVSLQSMAVADRAGEACLRIDSGDNSNNALEIAGAQWPADGIARQAELKVNVTTLDDLGAHVPRVHLIKIDVQGGEPQVLEGAEHMIARDRPTLVVEAVSTWPSTPRIYDFLIRHNYRVFSVDERGEVCPVNSPRAFVSWDWVGLPG
jgi:FkbM family methyltransferase